MIRRRALSVGQAAAQERDSPTHYQGKIAAAANSSLARNKMRRAPITLARVDFEPGRKDDDERE